MNESFGYPILENKYAGNLVLVHENSETLPFHLNSEYVWFWNKDNIRELIANFLNKYDD